MLNVQAIPVPAVSADLEDLDLVGLVKVLANSVFGAEIEKIPVWGLLLAILIVRPSGLFGHTHIGKGKF